MGIERTLHMVEVHAKTSDGTELQDPMRPWAYLAAAPRGQRRIFVGSDEYVVDVAPRPGGFRGTFSRIRLHDYPKKQRRTDGALSPLPVAEDEGLDFRCHFILWDLARLPRIANHPRSRPVALLVWETNAAAARYTQFEFYLNQVLIEQYILELSAVCADDPFARLDGAPEWGKITLQLGYQAAARANGGPWSEIFGSAPEETRAVEITLKPKWGHKYTPQEVRAAIARFQRGGAQAFVERMRVHGARGQILDLLEGPIRTRVTVNQEPEGADGRSRAVDPGSAYAALGQFFVETRDTVMAILGRRWVPPPK